MKKKLYHLDPGRFTKLEYQELRRAIKLAHEWRGAGPPEEYADWDEWKKGLLHAVKRFAPKK